MGKTRALIGLIAILVCFSSCGKKSGQGENNNDTLSNEQTSITVRSNTVGNPDDIQQDNSEKVNREEPNAELFQYLSLPNESFDAMTTEKCRLLPLPDESAKELGFLWQYHRVNIIERVQVSYQDSNQQAIWYLVKLLPMADNTYTIGWLPEEVVTEYDSEAQLPKDAMYVLVPDARYYSDGTAHENNGTEQETNPFFLRRKENDSGLSLFGYGDWEITVESTDCIRPADEYMLPPSWSNVP